MGLRIGSNYVNRPPLSLMEKVDLPLRLFIWAPIQLTINLVRILLACLLHALPLRPFLACAAIRTLLYTFAPRQLQLLSPSTLATYTAFIRATRARARGEGDDALLEQLQEDVEPLPDGRSHLLWLGDRTKATKFVYFFHGGGYISPAIAGHLEWCLQTYVLAPRHAAAAAGGGGGGAAGGGAAGGGSSHDDKKKEERVAVAMLQYTLAPSAQFPTQLGQAAAGLRHLLETHGIRPSQLVVGGDSAGGNLTMQLLSHLLHPYPGSITTTGTTTTTIPRADPITLAEPLAGAFLVSPLVSGQMTTRSFQDGKKCDMLSAGIVAAPLREMCHEQQQRGGLVGGAYRYLFPWKHRRNNWVPTAAFREGPGWAVPVDVEESWLDGMARIVGQVYVTVGRHEILRDQGIEVAERIRRRNPTTGTGKGKGARGVPVLLEVADKEAHDFILLEGERREVGDATVRMRSWFSQVWGW